MSEEKKDHLPNGNEELPNPAPQNDAAASLEASEPVVDPETHPTDEKAPESEPIMDAVEAEGIVDQNVMADIPPVVTEKPAHTPPKKKEPATPQEAVHQRHDSLEQAEVKEVLTVINKYVKPAAILIAIICGLVLTHSLIQNHRMKKAAHADADLLVARSAADYQAILDTYGKTPSAPLAQLGLAQASFNAGQIAEADRLYGEFIEKYPQHEMAAQASFNQITCTEAQGDYPEAAAAFSQFKLDHEESHLAPVALHGQARCLEASQNLVGAQQVYEDIMVFYPNSGWAQLAEQQLRILNAKM